MQAALLFIQNGYKPEDILIIFLPDNSVENSELNNLDDEPVIINFTFSEYVLTNFSHCIVHCIAYPL